MDTFTEQMGKVLDKMGQAFLVAGYLPAALFVLAHQLFLFPLWLGNSIALFQTPVPEEGADAAWRWTYLIDQSVTALVLPLMLGVLLMALNTATIKLYEGAYGWQKRFLLWPWQWHNRRRAKELYGNLVRLKEAYTETLAELAALTKEEDALPLKQKQASLALEIQRAHDEIVQQEPAQRWPRRIRQVKPTSLGNAFAVIEEYPYERYGMEGMVFWPRLYPLLVEPYTTTLTNTKMTLDLLLHLSLLASIFGLEVVLVGLWGRLDWRWVSVAIGAWVLAYLCYKGAVSTVYSLGDTVALCFDLHRGKLWEQFGFPLPTSLEQEQATWLRLGQFLRRGEGFYYPQTLDKALEESKSG
jgi:hypothetical protein